MKLKKIFSPSNILFLIILSIAIYTQITAITNNINQEGIELPGLNLELAVEEGSVQFPPKSKAIAFFWSTSCPPCKLEMARYKESINNGKIPEESFFAINPYESKETIEKFLKKNPHPFVFIKDKKLANFLNVQATPTTVLIENGKVHTMKTGLSVIGIWSAESFFKD